MEFLIFYVNNGVAYPVRVKKDTGMNYRDIEKLLSSTLKWSSVDFQKPQGQVIDLNEDADIIVEKGLKR
jgi:beta-lactam-binding protein with PASTA domain